MLRVLLAVVAALLVGEAEASTVNLASPTGTVGMGTDGTNLLAVNAMCGAASTVTLYATCVNQVTVNANGGMNTNILNTSLAVTVASGGIASGGIASGALAAGSISSGAAVSGAFVAGAIADLAHGQGTMAASVPVAIASNQSTLPSNTAQVNGVTTLTGTGAVGTGAQRVAVGTDTATIAGSAPSVVLQTNNAQWGGTAITNVPTAVGTAGTGNTPTVNAYIVGGAASSSNITQWDTTALGVPTAYGTAPTTGNYIGVNAYVTNTNGNGSAVSASSSPVVIASDQAAVAVKNSTASSFLGEVGGLGASGSALVGNPVQIGGSDGTDTRAMLMSSTGQPHVICDSGCSGSGGTSSTFGSAFPSAGTAAGAVTGGATGGLMAGVIQANASIAISQSATALAQIIALSSGRAIYVTSYEVVASGGANTVQFEYGTGTNCGTGTTALTGVNSYAANGGATRGGGLGPILVVPAGNALCLALGSATSVTGSLAYAQF